MPCEDESEGDPSLPTVDETLARIADKLGCPVDAFTEPRAVATGMKDASELLTIWVEMDDDADRAKLLDFARQLAAS